MEVCTMTYWSTRPTTVPAGSDHYFHTECPSVHPKTSKSSDNHCLSGLWAGQVDHWWLLSCSSRIFNIVFPQWFVFLINTVIACQKALCREIKTLPNTLWDISLRLHNNLWFQVELHRSRGKWPSVNFLESLGKKCVWSEFFSLSVTVFISFSIEQKLFHLRGNFSGCNMHCKFFDPLGRPTYKAGSDHYFRTDFRPSPLFKISQNKTNVAWK